MKIKRSLNHNKRGISFLIALLALIAIICLGTIAVWAGMQMFSVDPIGTDPEGDTFTGTVSILVSESNTLSPSTAVSSTSDDYNVYHSNGVNFDDVDGPGDLGGKVDYTVGTAADFSVSALDNGILFMYADPGTDYYLDVAETIDKNEAIITDYKAVDIDGDNYDEHLFELDVSDFDSSLTSNSAQITMYVYAEDTTIGISSPSDQDSLGTGTKTGTIEWQMNTISENYATCLAKVYAVSNDTTFLSQADITSLKITSSDGQEAYAVGGDITRDSGSKRFDFDIGVNNYRNLLDGIILARGTGDSSYFTITVGYETYFTNAANATQITLYFQTIGADEALDTVDSDAAVLGG